ncbi:MAG: response regulator [Microcoleus sp. PH2017_10_PVI_O_A]|uniref:adenylate/guanylate cyclase domain-containing response regulator n=1 Tax=unclassified Microcoleus TaxID=2642155 RepID=UPI001DD4B638|nr:MULTISPECIES: adenylate/guanylate cyclase domain-containing response regulator [unclassified Microcoleus]TAE84202.1 MAG: response regulator [Oscillatoriales cyanobacterium]MCC3407051.1 response regulator [Microcoleus sp. PH2017_10_PVI_O_A]MCC3459515.1 response regulator [Microcoleus sp. PH2017_11_PCY_U_A]MCC3477952.1 response regulator [Microcoleus sp. PH2017_12_PCY_D_A]MCC3529060.1 response regulator [Microcoleus sp. PH2017_21_RUC_O_A]
MISADFRKNSQTTPQILIVDDEATQQLFTRRIMEKEGYRVIEASNGQECLDICQETLPDIVLLDAMMPVMDGFTCCAELQANPQTQKIPVLMITALDDKKSVNQAFEVGATDYVTKPIHWPVLIQRVRRLIQQSQLYRQLMESQEKTQKLLLNILPESIALRLQDESSPDLVIADHFPNVSVLFADMVGFTKLASEMPPIELILKLNSIFSEFDQLTEEYGLEKIKTIGDGYMVASGLPILRDDHADAIVQMALAMQQAMKRLNTQTKEFHSLRIGIHSGPVVAGVIGTKKFSYDLWGDTVNTASRMQQYSFPGCIQVTEDTYKQLSKKHLFAERGMIDVKGKGKMKTYLLDCSEHLHRCSA